MPAKPKKPGDIEITGFPEIRSGGIPHDNSCTRQVYATWEVAENTARILFESGIQAEPERCKICGLIHLLELR